VSYQNIARPIMQYLSYFKFPRVLEIGVDNGQTTLPLCHNMSLLDRQWLYEGVDIRMKANVPAAIASMATIFCPATEPNIPVHPNVIFYEINSLNFLQDAIKNKIKYNLILIDGDHNYFTVQKELELAERIALPSTLIVCDDYNTRWANEDLYYAESNGYEKNKLATPRQKTSKVGVKAAVDEFVQNSNGKWGLTTGLGNEPDYCILYQKETVLDMNVHIPPDTSAVFMASLEVYFDTSQCPEVNENLLKHLDYKYERPGPRPNKQGAKYIIGGDVRHEQENYNG